MKVEIYTHTVQAAEVAWVLSGLANGMTDGGVVAIEPVAELFNVKKLKDL